MQMINHEQSKEEETGNDVNVAMESEHKTNGNIMSQ